MIENGLIQARLNQLLVTIWDKCNTDSRTGEDGRTKSILIESLSLSWTGDWTRESKSETGRGGGVGMGGQVSEGVNRKQQNCDVT